MDNELFDGNLVGQEKGVDNASFQKGHKFKMPGKRVVYAIVVLVLLGGAIFYFKSFFVVAMVNGRFISRVELVRETEKIAGKQALDSLIVRKLLDKKIKDIQVSKEEIDKETKTTEDMFTSRGASLKDVLASNKITEKDFRDRIIVQIKLKKLVADKIVVTDAEVTNFIKQNKVGLPSGTDMNTFKAQISNTIQQNKLNQAIDQIVATLKKEAKIRYFKEF